MANFWLFGILAVTLRFTVVSTLPIDENEIEEYDYSGIDEYSQEDYIDDVIDLSHMDLSIYGEPDNETGIVLSNWSPDKEVNPEELGSYLEGDILVPRSSSRNGLISQSSRWKNGVVPFEIQGSFSASDLKIMEQGMKEYHAKTCIRFVPRTNQKDYISFVNEGSGCWSSVGKIGGRQEVNLQSPGCLTKVGTFMHECMHALGFLHEQNRHERDNYVTIKWDNIQSSTKNNFDKASASTTDAYGVEYDYGSVMHYSAYAFSKNEQPTIVAKNSYSASNMGQRDSFSANDIDKLNAMYNCKSSMHHHPNIPSTPSYSNQGPVTWPPRPSRRPRPPPYNGNGYNPFMNLLNFFAGYRNDIDDQAENNAN